MDESAESPQNIDLKKNEPNKNILSRRQFLQLSLLSILTLAAKRYIPQHQESAGQNSDGYLTERWKPPFGGIKDHSIFEFKKKDGSPLYFLVSIDAEDESHFITATSPDLKEWTQISTNLMANRSSEHAKDMIWAPHLVMIKNDEGNDELYMFLTGVNNVSSDKNSPQLHQIILMARFNGDLNNVEEIISDPEADPWDIIDEFVFYPTHEGAYYPKGWADSRDSMIHKGKDGIYYLFYTGVDQDPEKGTRGIIGVATSDKITGPFEDKGAVFGGEWGKIERLESPYLLELDNGWHGMVYTLQGDDVPDDKRGTYVRYSKNIMDQDSWSSPQKLPFGWAFEFLKTEEGLVVASFCMGYDLSVARVFITYEENRPPRISIGERLDVQTHLPLVIKK